MKEECKLKTFCNIWQGVCKQTGERVREEEIPTWACFYLVDSVLKSNLKVSKKCVLLRKNCNCLFVPYELYILFIYTDTNVIKNNGKLFLYPVNNTAITLYDNRCLLDFS